MLIGEDQAKPWVKLAEREHILKGIWRSKPLTFVKMLESLLDIVTEQLP